MTGFLPEPPTNDQLLEWEINISWMPRPTHLVTQAALYEYVRDYMERGTDANRDFLESHQDNPLVNGQLKLGGEQIATQRALEEKYLPPESLDKYRRSAGRGSA